MRQLNFTTEIQPHIGGLGDNISLRPGEEGLVNKILY